MPGRSRDWGCLLLCAFVEALSSSGCGASARPDQGLDPPSPSTTPVTVDDAVLSIAITPYELVPPFSQSTHDYYVRCPADTNSLDLTVTTASGTTTSTETVLVNQAVVVSSGGGDYWIRCLPSDFPNVVVTPHPNAGAPTPGYYLVNGATYAIALDTNGTPVWYRAASSVIDVQSFGHDAISFVPNAEAPLSGDAAVFMNVFALDTLDENTIQSPDADTDAHELQPLANGDVMIFTVVPEPDWDLTGLGAYGENETLAGCQIEELSPNGSVVWSWRASEHIDPVQESLNQIAMTLSGGPAVDVFHCNSIDVDAKGNLLVSVRHTNAVYYVDRATGSIQWKLGGTSFNKDGATHVTVTGDPQTSFSLQHDARFTPSGDVTLYDDHGVDQGSTAGVARGVEYSLDVASGTAKLVWQFLGTAAAQYEGSCRRYADGHSVVGWGYVPTDPRVLTEVDASGNDVLDVAFTAAPPQAAPNSYRAIKVPTTQLDIDVLRKTAGL